MEIKDLNKPQLIMLALLLSFVTSIATGITTVTLLQQAPASIVTPINNVVRETVEKIVPVPGKDSVQTVIIKEEDLIVDAISKNQDFVFRIVKDTTDGEGKISEVSVGRGFVVSSEGIIVLDAKTIEEGVVYFAINKIGKFETKIISIDKTGFALLKIGKAVGKENNIVFSTPVFGDINKMKIGQKILVFGDSLSSFMYDGNKDLKLDVSKSKIGAMVLNIDGEILGVALSNDVSFVPIHDILENLKPKSSDTKVLSQ